MNLPFGFSYIQEELHCERVPVRKIAEAADTPTYVYSKAALTGRFRDFHDTFASLDPLIRYSVKANSNLEILRVLKGEGVGFDIVSLGELFRLRQIGVDPANVVFSGVGKSIPEFEAAARSGIGCLQVESIEELESLVEWTRAREARLTVSFRFNPDVDADTHPYISTGERVHKFGLGISQAKRVVELLGSAPGVEAKGVGFHIGSQILDIRPFVEAFEKIRDLARDLLDRGVPIEHIDIGGGFGISYQGEQPLDLPALAAFLGREAGPFRLMLEPGRYLVAEAGILLNRVLYRKALAGKSFVVVDGAMNDLMRPALYQAHHDILPARRSEPTLTADVVGPVCESGDFFARDRRVADFRPGDLMAVMNVGAYGFTLASNYNSRPRAAEILVEGDRFKVVRRRETWEDLLRGEE